MDDLTRVFQFFICLYVVSHPFQDFFHSYKCTDMYAALGEVQQFAGRHYQLCQHQPYWYVRMNQVVKKLQVPYFL